MPMALVHPSDFGANLQTGSEHVQHLLQSRNAKAEKGPTTTPCHDVPTLPLGFPISLNSNLAWSVSELLSEGEYIYHATQEDNHEIHNALNSFKAHGMDGDLVNSTNFPLPNLQHILRQLSLELHNGRGFCVIRDLEYKRYSVEDSTIIFLGIQSFIAETRARQDEKGNMLVHIITDDTVASNPLKQFHTRHSKSSIPFHTDDLGDILAFQTRSAATRGGNCILSPAYTIYNELVAKRPDVIWTLSEPNWPLHIPYYHQRPLLFYKDSRIIFNFSPSALLGSKAHPRPTSIPSVSPHQLEALTLVQALAEKHKIAIRTQKGDLHFFNNLALLHRRDAPEVAPGSKRHLVRMYLRNQALAWKIPEALDRSSDWEEAYRQGDDVEQVWHIEPMPDVFFPLIRKAN